MGATWSKGTPCPREFDCRLCGAHVYVDDRSDRRTVFCSDRCQVEWWRHRDRYERRKDISRGHVVHAWQMGRAPE